MIAHFEDGTSRKLNPTAATIGLRVVRWEFDFNDMRELLANPELLPILFTRMPPTSPQREWVGLTDEELDEAEDVGAKEYRRWKSQIRGQLLMPQDCPEWHIYRAIEAKLKEKNT